MAFSMSDESSLVATILCSYVQTHKETLACTNFAPNQAPNINKYIFDDFKKFGYGCIYYENKEDEACLNEEVSYTTFEGLSLVAPYSGSIL